MIFFPILISNLELSSFMKCYKFSKEIEFLHQMTRFLDLKCRSARVFFREVKKDVTLSSFII
jgi:hypothetical protein